MSISRRKYIQFPPSPPSSTEDVLVLTTRARRFIDVRLSDEKQLDWAFAGTSTSVPHPHHLPSTAPTTTTTTAADEEPAWERGREYCTWHHALDSRTDTPELDEGWCTTAPDAPLETLERGYSDGKRMVEVWRDEEVRSKQGEERRVAVVLVRNVVLESENSGAEEFRPALGDGEETRGVVIRLGHHIQGMVKGVHGTSVVRWQYGEGGGKGVWEEEYANIMPDESELQRVCGFASRVKGTELGSEVEVALRAEEVQGEVTSLGGWKIVEFDIW